MNLRTELIRVAKENPNLRGDLLPLLTNTNVSREHTKRTAGFDVEIQTVYISLIPVKRNFAVNVDTFKTIEGVWVDIEGNGAVHATIDGKKTSKEYFTGPSEKMGARNETVLTLGVPVEAKVPLLRGIAKALTPTFKVEVLPRYREPVSVPAKPASEEYKSPLSRKFR